MSKRQSPTTVLFRTTLTQTITIDELLILLCSNLVLIPAHRFSVTLYNPDTSLRRTVGAGPDGVRLRESNLVPRVSLLGGGKKRDPGNEVAIVERVECTM